MPSQKYNNKGRREKSEGDSEIFGIVLIIVSAFIFLCITVRPILGIISRGIYGVTTGIFGLFAYPLFLSTLLWGIAIVQGRSANLPVRAKIGIAGIIVSLMLLLQLATTHAHLGDGFSAYMSYVFRRKTAAGGVLFGVVAYAIQSVTTPIVSYIIYSLLMVCFATFCLVLPLYGRRKAQNVQAPEQPYNPFVKGMAPPQQTRPLGDTSLFVDTIRVAPPQDDSFAPLDSFGQAPAPVQKPTNSQGVQFAPYTPKQNTHDGYKSEAHKILFGGTHSEILPTPTGATSSHTVTPPDKFALPPVVTSEPHVKDTTMPPSEPTAPVPTYEQPPVKPQKRVHGGLGEVPQVPEKDFSNQVVGGMGIINGDDFSRKLAETMTPLTDREETPKAEPFALRKIEPVSVQPKVPSEPEPSAIVNGDYFGMPQRPPAQAAASTPEIKFTGETEEKPSAPAVEEQKEEPIAPIICGSDYERENSAEQRFLAQLDEDRRSARKARENVYEKPVAPVIEDDELSDLYASDLPLGDEEDDRLIADDIPTAPVSSGLKIEEEPIDLSEQSHFDGNDNTGYYNSMSLQDIAPVSSQKTEKQPVLRAENQIKIDDYVAGAPEPPKPKKKKHVKYNAPDIDMLIASDNSMPEDFNVACEERARVLEASLQEFKLPAKVTGITRGPAVTRFELEMPPGISVKRVEQFSHDIEYNLASNGKIRIEAPIPGKRAVGIEVPNGEIDVVRLREIIESKEFQNSSSPLTLALGKDIAGSNIICNLEKMPHLLIAGATGSGKSACLNSIIISILYKSSPEDVRMILIDPKRVEFNMYQGIPHLMGADIVNDAQQALNVLTWAKDEMDRRYMLFGTHRVRNLPEFNKSDAVKSGEQAKLPYIVLIVDELAELMMENKKVLEGKIMSIAQKARAAGIHMILATQRPSVDVITGTIKANLPSRIAFTVKSIVDSRTILDVGGAETLLGRGDMLYSPVGMDDPKRVQGAFVTDKEVLAVSEYVRANNEADFDEEFTATITKREEVSESEGEDDDDAKEFDSLMPEVLKCVIESGSASTSMIQRRFSVGYARASRIIDQMEMHKFIGPLDGSKPRAVYITREQYRELFGQDI